MTCSQCGYVNPPDAQLCEGCGHELSPAPKTCPDCGTANSATARFCNSCGHAFGAKTASAATRKADNPLPLIAAAVILLGLLVLSMTMGAAPAPPAADGATPLMIRVLATI